jgi:hypothetical protein
MILTGDRSQINFQLAEAHRIRRAGINDAPWFFANIGMPVTSRGIYCCEW